MSDDINLSELLARRIRKAAGKHDDPRRSVECIVSAMADRIEALDTENARLRRALEYIADMEKTGMLLIREPIKIARAALSQDNPQRDQRAGDQADDA